MLVWEAGASTSRGCLCLPAHAVLLASRKRSSLIPVQTGAGPHPGPHPAACRADTSAQSEPPANGADPEAPALLSQPGDRNARSACANGCWAFAARPGPPGISAGGSAASGGAEQSRSWCRGAPARPTRRGRSARRSDASRDRGRGALSEEHKTDLILSRARKPHPGIQLISTETPNRSCSERWLSTYSFCALSWRRAISTAPAAGKGTGSPGPPQPGGDLHPGGAQPRWDPSVNPCPGKVLLFQTRPNDLPKHPSLKAGWKPPRRRLCSTRVLSHLAVAVLCDNTHSRGVFGVSQAGGHRACPGARQRHPTAMLRGLPSRRCCRWVPRAAQHPARPPRPAELGACSRACPRSLQPAQRCRQTCSRNASASIREPLVPSAEQQPAGEHLHHAPVSCELRIAAPPRPCTCTLHPCDPAFISYTLHPCTLHHCNPAPRSYALHHCTCILHPCTPYPTPASLCPAPLNHCTPEPASCTPEP